MRGPRPGGAALNLTALLEEAGRGAALAVKKTGDATFPAFTVCPAFGASYKEDVLRCDYS